MQIHQAYSKLPHCTASIWRWLSFHYTAPGFTTPVINIHQEITLICKTYSNLLSVRSKTNNINVTLQRQKINRVKDMQIRWEQLGSLRVYGESAVLITAKKCQTLDEYSEKTVRGAMGCDVLKANYNYSRIR